MASSLKHPKIFDLKPEVLALAGDYRALAALAVSDASEGESALEELAGSCENADAFRWVWEIQQSRSHIDWAELVEHLPEGLSIPPDVQPDVRKLILGDSGGDAGGRAALLCTLDPRIAVELAREIANDDDLIEEAYLRDAVLTVFGLSQGKADRVEFFELVDDMPAQDRIRALALMKAKFHRGDQERMVKIFIGAMATDNQQPVAFNTDDAARAMRRFTPKTQVRVLNEISSTGGVRQQVVSSLAKFEPLRAGKLLGVGVEDSLALDIATGASTVIRVETLARILAEHHNDFYASSCFKAGRDKVAVGIRGGGSTRDDLLLDYWRMVAGSSDDAPANELAAIIEPGELAGASSLPAKGTEWRSIGRVFGLVMQRLSDDDCSDGFVAVTAPMLPLHAANHAEFIGGLVESASSFEEFSDEIVYHFAATREAVACLVDDEEYEATVLGVEAVQSIDGTSRAAVDLFCLGASEGLDDGQIGRAVGLINWQEADDYGRYVDCLRDHPDRMAAEVHRAMDSWEGKAAQRIPSDQLVGLITGAVDSGFSDGIRNQIALGKLLSHPNESVPMAVVRWIEASGDITNSTVVAVIGADRESSGKIGALAELRNKLGERLTAVANDADSEIPDRVSALQLATDAYPKAARATAFGLARNDDKELRSAAADTLIGTTDHEGDEGLLEAWIKAENVTPIEMKLKQALRSISMETIDEAIERLISILDVEIQFSELPDASVLLPDDRWHESFINDVDDLRRANYESDSPRSFINVACSLTETMAKQALVARHEVDDDATSLNDDTAELIRTNVTHTKLGRFLHNIQNMKTFPWFNALLSLIDYRTAHPAPLGQTTPLKLGDREYRATVVYLEAVFVGWIGSMYKTDRLARAWGHTDDST